VKKNKSYYKSKDFIGLYLRNKRIKNIIKYIDGKLIDIACGDNFLVKKYRNGNGVDIVDYGADYVLKDYYNLPFDEKSIDTVTIVGAINYFEEPITVLKEIRRILKDDGQLIVTNTNHNIMKIWHLFRESWAFKYGYSKKEIKELLKKSEFFIKNKYYFNCFISSTYIIKKNIK
jgi:ubiquinone/menaquinone biosynthesis C-methylase UbiE